ncbi:MAG: hypothetical protein E8D47_06480 [Nitrospira sp.]|nr:MAG: hypothetical protein E8D47_06480 [Nitrospira sp.]
MPDPIIFDPIGTKTVNEQTELRFTISATDADLPAPMLIYSATGLPTGALFDAAACYRSAELGGASVHVASLRE